MASASPAGTPGVDPLVVVEDLRVHLPVGGGLRHHGGKHVRAVDGVSLSVSQGETLGVVGESGCGKSTLGLALLRLITPTSGSIVFAGRDISSDPPRRLKSVRRGMQLIFQDPIGSLNPRQRVGDIVRAGLDIQRIGTRGEREQQTLEALEAVGLRADTARRFPHELSGGQRQRVGIARALVMRPRFVVADEPVSALDVSIQSQVLNLLVDLKSEFGLTYLFISHNFAAIEYMSDRIAVMYLGKVVELGPAEVVCSRPLHPYTSALLAAVPRLDPRDRPEIGNLGEVPSAVDPPSGCRFRTRCPIATELCAETEPPLQAGDGTDHFVACHFAGRISEGTDPGVHRGAGGGIAAEACKTGAGAPQGSPLAPPGARWRHAAPTGAAPRYRAGNGGGEG